MTFFIGFLLFADADSGKYEDSKVSFGALLIFSNLAAVAVGCGYISHDRFGVAARAGRHRSSVRTRNYFGEIVPEHARQTRAATTASRRFGRPAKKTRLDVCGSRAGDGAVRVLGVLQRADAPLVRGGARSEAGARQRTRRAAREPDDEMRSRAEQACS